MKCFYHTDMDGHCSGAIIRKYTENDDSDGFVNTYIPINYKDDFPFDTIGRKERIFIVDFSLQKEGDFARLLKITPHVTWIDHHKTAIEKHRHLSDEIRGIRFDGKAGCVLTWEYCFPKKPLPQIVEMLGLYDIWDFKKYRDALNVLQAGIRLYETKPESVMWNIWLSENEETRNAQLSSTLEQGHTALRYRDQTYKGLIKSWSFFADFEGYKAICCNVGSVSSQLFDSVIEEYDIMIPFVFDGKQWTVSLYTKKENIDCSEMAQKYGGGGHKKAAGFQIKELPFRNES